ncbi:MAG: DNA polymerase III subunit delta' [Lachnospiraceae bacterium]|nr:DNA polymerase III subunit delta' [Lachnospiraceae bacterium]
MADFSELIGQEHIKEELKKALEKKTVSHAYIFVGEAGSGKSILAKRFAMALQCESSEGKPCMKCRSCKMALSDNHPDIITIRHEKPALISVDEVRKQLVDDMPIKPYSGPHKIYIIPEAHKMNLQAQNALLKTLEEPPSYGVIILLTDNALAMLPTIISRCTLMSLRPVKDSVIKEYLTRELHISDHQADLCIAFARGNPGRARNLAVNDSFSKLRTEVLYLIKNIKSMDSDAMFEVIKKLVEYKNDIDDILDMITLWYRDVLLYKSTENRDRLVFKDELEGIKEYSKRSSFEAMEAVIKKLDITRERLKASVKAELALELLLFTIKEN